jgi:hypothetical protein
MSSDQFQLIPISFPSRRRAILSGRTCSSSTSDFRNPRTTAFSLAVERVLESDLSASVTFNYAETDFLTRFANRNDPLLGSPWGTGLGADGTNGINTLTVVESTAHSKYWGVTLGLRKEFSHHVAFQLNYTYSKDRSDDDNERDPFSFRYAKITDLDAEWSLSDRDQTHRLNGWLLAQLPGDVDLNARYSYRSAQPKSIHFNGPECADGCDALTPQDRINPDGSVTQRNLGSKRQRVLVSGPALVPRVSHGSIHGRTRAGGLQPVQLQEPSPPRGHQPHLQLRRHGPEWCR